MQSSTTFDWERVITPLRWVARVLGVAAAVFIGYWALSALQSGLTWDVLPIIVYSILGVGLVVALFWTGIGELVGGLALVLGAVGLAYVGTFGLGILTIAVPVAVIGLLFIACGWYMQAQRSRGATPTTA